MSILNGPDLAIGPAQLLGGVGTAFSAATGIVLDGSTEKIGYKYYPMSTSAITDVDLRLTVVGAPGNFKIGVFADNGSGAPDSATQLGGYTGDWTIGASGWIGLQTLSSNTGALTKGTPVWIVIEYVSGTIDGSNSIQAQAPASSSSAMFPANRISASVRHHNGTNWTTTAPQTLIPLVVLKLASGAYIGFPLTSVLARSSQNDIYVNGGTTQTQGLKIKSGSQIKINGVAYQVNKAGTPNNLTFTVYEGDTSKYSVTEVAANIVSGTPHKIYFDSPILLAADTNLFILLTQTGTSDANDYDLFTWTFDPTYIGAIAPADYRFVYGDGTTPSSLSVSAGVEIPWLIPLIADPAADLDMTGGSGGMLVHPGMSGRLI